MQWLETAALRGGGEAMGASGMSFFRKLSNWMWAEALGCKTQAEKRGDSRKGLDVFFPDGYERIELEGAGHFPHRESAIR